MLEEYKGLIKKCRGCGKKVLWATDAEGKKQILDPSPAVYHYFLKEDGTLACTREYEAAVTHFATCPDAKRFSGGYHKKKPDVPPVESPEPIQYADPDTRPLDPEE